MTADQQALTDDELQTLQGILAKLTGQGGDLPWPLFRFITEVTATPNIDLIVQDAGKVLLAWRDDPFGAGWHVPGSVIRHREEVGHRITATANEEFGCDVAVDERPIALIQIFDDRGHSVSLCYRARLLGRPGKRVLGEGEPPAVGDLRWFATPPADLYPSHRVYRDLLDALNAGQLGEGVRLFTQHVGRRDAVLNSAAGAINSDAPLT